MKWYHFFKVYLHEASAHFLICSICLMWSFSSQWAMLWCTWCSTGSLHLFSCLSHNVSFSSLTVAAVISLDFWFSVSPWVSSRFPTLSLSVYDQKSALYCGPPTPALLWSAGAEPQSQSAGPLPSQPASQPRVAAARQHHLPGAVRQLGNLTRLDLEDNRIRAIQPGALQGLNKLQVLTLKGKQADKPPSITDSSWPQQTAALSWSCPHSLPWLTCRTLRSTDSPGECLWQPVTSQIFGPHQQPVGVWVWNFLFLPLAAQWQAEDGHRCCVHWTHSSCSLLASKSRCRGFMSSCPEAKWEDAPIGPKCYHGENTGDTEAFRKLIKANLTRNLPQTSFQRTPQDSYVNWTLLFRDPYLWGVSPSLNKLQFVRPNHLKTTTFLPKGEQTCRDNITVSALRLM